jgi:hypoxanthine phosphoribosyltransferase
MEPGSSPDPLPAADPMPVAGPAQTSRPNFAHASEAEMARILDFYQVRWEYEPHVFPVVWNLDGAVIESFAPDFWLPDLDLYLEMTTLRQKLVRKKNRKLRRVLELYPDLRVKLFYARDFRALMLKFGRLALADALSGASGQVVPERELAAIGLLDASDEPDPGEPGAIDIEPDRHGASGTDPSTIEPGGDA